MPLRNSSSPSWTLMGTTRRSIRDRWEEGMQALASVMSAVRPATSPLIPSVERSAIGVDYIGDRFDPRLRRRGRYAVAGLDEDADDRRPGRPDRRTRGHDPLLLAARPPPQPPSRGGQPIRL